VVVILTPPPPPPTTTTTTTDLDRLLGQIGLISQLEPCSGGPPGHDGSLEATAGEALAEQGLDLHDACPVAVVEEEVAVGPICRLDGDGILIMLEVA